ncbi:MAG: hypothetical protein WCW65_03435 [Candidatus Paceibacterota bacterium]
MKEFHPKIKNIVENFEPLPKEEIDLLDDGDKYEYYKNLEIYTKKENEKLMKNMVDAAEREAKDLKEEALKKHMDDLYRKDPDEPYWQR